MRSRRGIFFTMMAIVVLTLFLVSYSFYSVTEERKSVQERIETMNSFIQSMDADLERQVYISGFRMTFLLVDHVITEDYITDANASYHELFFNKTINGESTNLTQLVMQDAGFDGIVALANEYGSEVNLEVSLENEVFEVVQSDPWTLTFSVTIDLNIEDASGVASWGSKKTYTNDVSVEGFDDPTYLQSVNVFQQITKSPYSTIDSTNIVSHAEGPYYIASTTAPDFMSRLEGDFEAEDIYGIESLVRIAAIEPEYQVHTRSIVDHEYFRGIGGNVVGGAPSWVKLSSSNCINNNPSANYEVNC